LETQRGSNVCIKTPTKESPECLTIIHHIPVRAIITNIVLDMKVNGSEFIENSGI
jgi:hypothetical protein